MNWTNILIGIIIIWVTSTQLLVLQHLVAQQQTQHPLAQDHRGTPRRRHQPHQKKPTTATARSSVFLDETSSSSSSSPSSSQTTNNNNNDNDKQEKREGDGGLEDTLLLLSEIHSKFENQLPDRLARQLEPLYPQQLPWKRQPGTGANKGKMMLYRDMDEMSRRQQEIVPLSSLVDLDLVVARGGRLVYVDLGSRDPPSSLEQFVQTYPGVTRERTWHMYGWEADPEFWPLYQDLHRIAGRHPVQLVRAAAWTENTTLQFGGPMGFIGGKDPATRQELLTGQGTSRQVQALDFSSWLRRTVSRRDFVVLKMDIECAEWTVLPHMLRENTVALVDELFLECHHWEWNQPLITASKPYTRSMCVNLMQQLRRYSFAHEWY